MHEDLIGYVLGLLETEEHIRFERLLETDEAVRVEVEVVRRSLIEFEVTRQHHDPPSGLAQRTCQRLRRPAEE
jgi:anti-sigma-K factor RskA